VDRARPPRGMRSAAKADDCIVEAGLPWRAHLRVLATLVVLCDASIMRRKQPEVVTQFTNGGLQAAFPDYN